MPKITPELAEDMLPTEEKPNVGSVFDDLKERISSPFIFSFVLSFLVANWRIIIGLMFLDKTELYARGVRDQVDFVSQALNWGNGLFWPLGGALFYCFVYPWFRDQIKIVHAKRLTKTTKKLNRVASSYPVPMRKYAAKVAEVNNLTQTLSTLMNKENEVHDENAQLVKELADTKNRLRESSQQVEKWEASSRSSILDGNWEVKSIVGEIGDISIKGKQVIGKITYSQGKIVSTKNEIKNFIYNQGSKLIYMELAAQNAGPVPTIFLVLKVNDDFTLLEGKLNNVEFVTFFKSQT
jgi:hypothetical protein